MDIHPFLAQKSAFTLFLAPPGWGKTTLLLDLYQKNLIHLVFVSPLRALANEFYGRIQELGRVHLIEKRKDLDDVQESFLKKNYGCLVVTPETLNDDFLFQVKSSERSVIFVLDEFHLFYYWGHSFRPLLWEFCLGIANTGSSILGLTATIENHLLNDWKRDFFLGMNELYLINLGNRQLKKLPSQQLNYRYVGKKLFNKHFVRELRTNEKQTYLYFCRFRGEVDQWLRYCQRERIFALGCKGGEVREFLNNLDSNNPPRCIFSTTTLSHGVNLPEISKVFLSYPIESRDFWLQMAGRGGRNGQTYQVYSFGDNESLTKEGVFDVFKILLRSLRLLFA